LGGFESTAHNAMHINCEVEYSSTVFRADNPAGPGVRLLWEVAFHLILDCVRAWLDVLVCALVTRPVC
jgi:hypothetical protein